MVADERTSAPKHRTARGAQRVRDLTEAAAELFLERGFDAVAVDDLIARVGGSRSTIYSHFGGKEGLFRHAMIDLCTEVARPLEQLNIADGEPGEVLPVLGRQLLRSALSSRTLALHRLLVNEGRRFPDVARAMWDVSYGKAIQILSVWIAAQQQPGKGLGRDVPAKALAEHFVSLVAANTKLQAASGLRSPTLTDAEIEEIVGHAVQIFLHGAAGGQTDEDSKK
ncbi:MULTISPECIES: TetR/AcrR family transcriptional regulator [Enterobacterales]|uniref:TetR/AcrR family transcriptional regulator n=1 Tax=Candidatus Pantoea gossypiicola TaxID=2608008 RepID=A0AB34CJE8_9GAMM|nr:MULTISPECIES: TetR/AcrR family transcriptional regulator [Enterobacterales]ELS0727558.1 TetR/AcrR family transcriptional regulator [Klebsiella michiganensis]MBE3536812.1 TetR/AcrR family transcriptional regulator [Enterobacter cloacae complex sp. I3]MCB3584543.1 TetR/AcrR family transcriptional regulator [Klebsiella pneumoniae]HBU6431310.1 TetR/AcrR family transcriptional regulator [Klebsiella oxytoca]AKM88233.1 TetR family transcriptional regulator [Enterobacter ludwigii]